MKKAAFYTLGCKLNFAETSTLKRQFTDHNFKLTGFGNEADVYVINTCSVTRDANRDCRKIVRQALRHNPQAFIAVTGCYAQLEPEEIAAIEGVDLVLGMRDKFNLFDLIDGFEKKDHTVIHRTDVNEAVDFHHAFSSGDRTRAFLKIQDGCDYRCAFCTIPLARGKSRSPAIGTILENASTVIRQGYQEIVLTGVNAGDFGKQHGESFCELLIQLETLASSGLRRIRTSSIEPNLLTDEIIELAAASRVIQPHFHIPLQSGSDEMLKLMRRRYRTDLYREKVEKIKALMPHACIGVDVITGHPGETESLFRESFRFIENLDVSYLHVFSYSERPNTTALEIQGSVPPAERKKRTHQLRRLSDKKRYDFDTRHSGQLRPVLFEMDNREGQMFGWTDNYIRAALPFDSRLAGKILPCRLVKRTVEGYFTSEPDRVSSAGRRIQQPVHSG